jgi:hypothetical protein
MFDTLVGKAMDLLAGRINESRKEKDEQHVLVQEVQIACDTRAVYTAMHAQLDIESMFAALIATRRKLQGIKAKISDAAQQQRVANIIGELDIIERKKLTLTSDWENGSHAINLGKTRIIGLVRDLSDAAGLPYCLPANLTQELFWEVEQAMAPATAYR